MVKIVELLVDFNVEDLEGVRAIHIKSFIQLCQNTGTEINSTINGSVSTLRLFNLLLVDEEYIEEFENPNRRIKDLKEENGLLFLLMMVKFPK